MTVRLIFHSLTKSNVCSPFHDVQKELQLGKCDSLLREDKHRFRRRRRMCIRMCRGKNLRIEVRGRTNVILMSITPIV